MISSKVVEHMLPLFNAIIPNLDISPTKQP